MGSAMECQTKEEQEEYGQIKIEFRKYFPREERREVYSFFNRGFCIQGKIELSKIFLAAAKQGKLFKDIMIACEAQYQRFWRDQHISIRGNPAVDSVAGMQSKISLNNIYEKLEIPSPFKDLIIVR